MRRDLELKKSMLTAWAAISLLGMTVSPALAGAGPGEFRGRWSRDCGVLGTCALDIDATNSSKTLKITFSLDGNKTACKWSVPATYEESWGGPVAHDPYGNYYFYLTVHEDGRLYSSGTMLPTCGGPLPLDQYYVRNAATDIRSTPISTGEADAAALTDNREVFDHNGSDTVISPRAGTIIYQKPKSSISGSVKPGALLFKSNAPWDPYDDRATIKGTAYTFKAGCSPAPYEVSGKQKGWHTLVLRGAAPVREKNGCRVIDYKMSSNSTLRFVSVGD